LDRLGVDLQFVLASLRRLSATTWFTSAAG
jgi:hypothetical protein